MEARDRLQEFPGRIPPRKQRDQSPKPDKKSRVSHLHSQFYIHIFKCPLDIPNGRTAGVAKNSRTIYFAMNFNYIQITFISIRILKIQQTLTINWFYISGAARKEQIKLYVVVRFKHNSHSHRHIYWLYFGFSALSASWISQTPDRACQKETESYRNWLHGHVVKMLLSIGYAPNNYWN